MATLKHGVVANYTTVSNDILRNRELSFQARGILCLYLSNRPGTEVSNEYLERMSAHNGELSVATAVNQLIEAGYYRREKRQVSGGHWVTEVTVTSIPWQFEPDDEAPTAAPPTPGNPGTGEGGTGTMGGKSLSTSEKDFSYESAGAEGVDRLPHRVQPTSRPTKKSTGPRRIVPAEESPGTSRTVGIPTSTERVRHTKAAREAISRPDSGGGLAAEFGQRVSEAGLSGPQAVNGPALARRLTDWMQAPNNPDTPERIRAMFDRFFEKPGGSEDYPLWRRFLSDGPRLRSTERKAAPTDWAQAQVNHRQWLEERAAAGDIRAENALSGANRPWMDPKYAPKESANADQS